MIETVPLQPPVTVSAQPVELLTFYAEPAKYTEDSPLVVLFAGFGSSREQALRELAQPFVDEGLAVRCISVPFDIQRLRTSDWVIDHGLPVYVSSLHHATRPLILAGVSRGAALAAAMASHTDIDYQCLVLMSPLGLVDVNVRDYLLRTIRDARLNVPPKDLDARMQNKAVRQEMLNHLLSRDGLYRALKFAMSQRKRVSPGIMAAHAQGKLLAVFCGESDLVFPPNECRQALQNLIGTAQVDKVFHLMPGGHAAATTIARNRRKIVAAWLRKQYS